MLPGNTNSIPFIRCWGTDINSQVARAWDSSISGTCVDREIVARGVYVYSSVNIVLDWLYAILPMPLLWNLQMNTRVKLSVMFVLSLGVL